MGRVKAFGTLSNEHRSVSVGGRRANHAVYAWLNTDNHRQSDCGLHVSAVVHGVDNVSRFHLELPDQKDDGCFIFVAANGRGKPDMRKSIGSNDLRNVISWYSNYENIYLPGGYTMGKALACINYCESRGLCSHTQTESMNTAGPDFSSQRRPVVRH